MGRIPIFIYTDVPWIPYAGTEIGIETFGFVAHRNHETGANNLTELVHTLKNLTVFEYEKKIKHLKVVRQYYTMDGYFGEVGKFFRDPFGPQGGYLRCGPHPVGQGTIMNWHKRIRN